MNPGASPWSAPDAQTGEREAAVLRGALLVVATIVIVQAGLGFAGFLRAAPVVIALLVVVLPAAVVVYRGHKSRTRSAREPSLDVARDKQPDGQPWTAADTAGAAALMAALCERAWAGLHRTTFLYDVLSYHLHLPAAWHTAGRLTLVPTPFGDPAPGYTPSNAELAYHLLLAATGNATLAHAGQIPFAALAVLAIHTTARVLGASRAAGFAAALAFLLIPEVWQQAPTAMADLALASLFLAAIPFLLRLQPQRSWPDLVGLGLALGLLVGTKYVAVVLSAPIVLWTAIILGRRLPGVGRAPASAFVGALALTCGGFWYTRNAILTGNPLFPATLAIGSMTLAKGLLDGALIRASEYHLPVRHLQPLLEILLETGWGFVCALAMGLGFALAGGGGRRWPWPGFALLTGVLTWFVVPYQQSRFFFPLWGAVAILLAAVAARAPRLGLLALGAATLGAVLQFPTPGRLGVLGAAVVGAVVGPRVMALSTRFERRVSPRVASGAWYAIFVLMVGVAITWARARPTPPPYVVGDHHDAGWAWVREHAVNRRIAYAGSNLPFPLWGPRFENDVRYVGIAGGPGSAPHDFVDLQPSPATSTEPAPERRNPDQRAWLANLDTHRIDLLFVASLYPEVRRSMAHDAAGFPVERAWADARPDRFSLAFTSDGIRIYHHRTTGMGAAR